MPVLNRLIASAIIFLSLGQGSTVLAAPVGRSVQGSAGTSIQAAAGPSVQAPAATSNQARTGTSIQAPAGTSIQAPAGSTSKSKSARGTISGIIESGYDALNRYRADEAILAFSRAMRAHGTRPLKDSRNATALVHDLVLISRAFSFDENDLPASQCLTIALALVPGDPSATAYLAHSLDQMGDKRAGKLLASLEKSAKDDPIAAEVVASAAMRRFDFERAAKFLSNPAFAANAHVQVLLSRALARSGQTEKAAQYYLLAAKHASNAYIAKLITVFSQIASEKQVDEKLLWEAGEIRPDDPRWHIMLAHQLSFKYDKKAFDQYVASVNCARLDSQAFVGIAAFLIQRKKADAAFRYLDYFQKLVPWSTRARLSRADALMKLERFDQAASNLKELLALNPCNAEAYYDLSNCYAAKGRNAEAESVLDQLTRACPYYPVGWRWLGSAAIKTGHWDKAFASCKRAVDLLDPTFKNLNVLLKYHLALAHAGMGAYYYRHNNLGEAIKEAKLYNQMMFVPKLPGVLSLVHLRPGRIDFANQSDAESKVTEHVLLADMLRNAGQTSECIAEYRAAVKLKPDDLDLHSYLLDALSDQGDVLQTARENLVLSSKLVNRIPHEVQKLVQRDKKPAPAPAASGAAN